MHVRREHGRLTLTLGLLGVSLAGCGPGGVGPPADADTGTTPDAGFEVLPPNIDWLDAGIPPIAPPSPPSLTPCAEGWREVEGNEEGAPITCAPYAEGGPDECADGWAHFAGEPGCTPVGAPCPVGDFPEGLPSDTPVLYALAGASAGGDGSEGAPVGTIAEAMALASAGTVVALGKGVYDEVVYLAAGVTLWGACAAETRLTASSPGLTVRGVVQVFAADTRLQNVRIGPADVSGLAVNGARADVAVDGVLIEGTREVGLLVTRGGRIHGRTLSVLDTRARSDGTWGFGIEVLTEGRVELRRVLLSRNRVHGVLAAGVGTSVTLTDLIVRDTQSQERNGVAGRGLAVQSGATAEIARAFFEGNRDFAILVHGAGTSVTLADVVLRGTQGQQSDGTSGVGLNVQFGATVEVTRALLERNHDVGVLLEGVGTSVALTDVVVRDTQGRESDGEGGRGLTVQFGATAEVARGTFERNRDVGVIVDGVGTSVALTDVVVRDTQSRESDGEGGRGLAVQSGATADVIRALFERNREVGVFVDGVGTSVAVTDVVVRDTQSQESDGEGGWGLAVQSGATADVIGALFDRNRELGIHVSNVDTSATLTDVVVRDTQSQERDDRGGRGLTMQDGATAVVTRAVFAHNRGFGVIAWGGDAMARLTDIVVEETAEQRCAATTCPDRPYGVGLASISSSNMTATRFRVANSALCGVFLASHGALDLLAGQVSGSPIGVCLQVDGYSVTRLTEGVQYFDNNTSLDATSLPLPELSESVDPAP